MPSMCSDSGCVSSKLPIPCAAAPLTAAIPHRRPRLAGPANVFDNGFGARAGARTFAHCGQQWALPNAQRIRACAQTGALHGVSPGAHRVLTGYSRGAQGVLTQHLQRSRHRNLRLVGEALEQPDGVALHDALPNVPALHSRPTPPQPHSARPAADAKPKPGSAPAHCRRGCCMLSLHAAACCVLHAAVCFRCGSIGHRRIDRPPGHSPRWLSGG